MRYFFCSTTQRGIVEIVPAPPTLTADPLRTTVGAARVWVICCGGYVYPCCFFGQGRDLSVFSRLWLVNRTEMVLQHRDSSLAGGIDSTFMGDRMPQITQPGRQETTGTEGGGGGGVGIVDYRLHRSASVGTGALTPTKVSEVEFSWGQHWVRCLAGFAVHVCCVEVVFI